MKIILPCFILSLGMLCLVSGCGDSTGEEDFKAGVAAFEVRDSVRAERCFRDCLDCNPSHGDALVYLVRISLANGDLDEAARRLEAARTVVGDDTDVVLLDAQIAWHKKDYKRAIESFKLVADDASASKQTRADALVGIGIIDFVQNRRHQALVSFLSAMRLDRNNPSLHYHLALLYRDGFGYFAAAREHFEFYVRLCEIADPRVQKVQRQVIPELQEQITRVLASRPGATTRNSATCAAKIAEAEKSWKKGAYKNSRLRYEEALKADPISFAAAYGLARAIEKTDTTAAGRTRAYENYRLACSLNPSHTVNLMRTGQLALGRGAVAVAVECYNRAVAMNPSSTEAVDGLIRSLRKSGAAADAALYQRYRETLPRPKSKKR